MGSRIHCSSVSWRCAHWGLGAGQGAGYRGGRCPLSGADFLAGPWLGACWAPGAPRSLCGPPGVDRVRSFGAPWCDISQWRGGPELGCTGPPALAGPARCPRGSGTVGHRVRPVEQGPDPRGLRPQRPRVGQRPGQRGPFAPHPCQHQLFPDFLTTAILTGVRGGHVHVPDSDAECCLMCQSYEWSQLWLSPDFRLIF